MITNRKEDPRKYKQRHQPQINSNQNYIGLGNTFYFFNPLMATLFYYNLLCCWVKLRCAPYQTLIFKNISQASSVRKDSFEGNVEARSERGKSQYDELSLKWTSWINDQWQMARLRSFSILWKLPELKARKEMYEESPAQSK